MDIVDKIRSVVVWIRDFFVLMWKYDDFWWYMGGLILVIIGLCKIFIVPLWRVFSSVRVGLSRPRSIRSFE